MYLGADSPAGQAIYPGLAGAIPLHSYTIPYQFTDSEAADWLVSQSTNVVLQGYLQEPQLRPAGIMVEDGYSQIIVWVDAVGKLHIIDATNMGVAQHVNDASFQSPDSSIVANALDELKKFIEQLQKDVQWLPIVALIVLGLWAYSWLPRRA